MSIKLYQLSLDQSVVNCGMSYVFKLEKGEFFIIDGGYFTEGEAERLYSFLKEKSKEKKPVINWLFTHAHQDHIGCFMDFVLKYGKECQIKQIMFNFQPIDLSMAKGNSREKSNDIATVKEFYEIIEKHCADIPIHTLKTGEIIDIGDISLEVLYTADDILPKEVSFNDYSCVFKVFAENQSVLFLGDIEKEASKWLLKNKREKLKSDIVQVSHHGFEGATKHLYEEIGAEIAMFPCPDYEFEKNIGSRVNGYIITSAAKCLVSGYKTYKITFPFEQ